MKTPHEQLKASIQSAKLKAESLAAVLRVRPRDSRILQHFDEQLVAVRRLRAELVLSEGLSHAVTQAVAEEAAAKDLELWERSLRSGPLQDIKAQLHAAKISAESLASILRVKPSDGHVREQLEHQLTGIRGLRAAIILSEGCHGDLTQDVANDIAAKDLAVWESSLRTSLLQDLKAQLQSAKLESETHARVVSAAPGDAGALQRFEAQLSQVRQLWAEVVLAEGWPNGVPREIAEGVVADEISHWERELSSLVATTPAARKVVWQSRERRSLLQAVKARAESLALWGQVSTSGKAGIALELAKCFAEAKMLQAQLLTGEGASDFLSAAEIDDLAARELADWIREIQRLAEDGAARRTSERALADAKTCLRRAKEEAEVVAGLGLESLRDKLDQVYGLQVALIKRECEAAGVQGGSEESVQRWAARELDSWRRRLPTVGAAGLSPQAQAEPPLLLCLRALVVAPPDKRRRIATHSVAAYVAARDLIEKRAEQALAARSDGRNPKAAMALVPVADELASASKDMARELAAKELARLLGDCLPFLEKLMGAAVVIVESPKEAFAAARSAADGLHQIVQRIEGSHFEDRPLKDLARVAKKEEQALRNVLRSEGYGGGEPEGCVIGEFDRLLEMVVQKSGVDESAKPLRIFLRSSLSAQVSAEEQSFVRLSVARMGALAAVKSAAMVARDSVADQEPSDASHKNAQSIILSLHDKGFLIAEAGSVSDALVERLPDILEDRLCSGEALVLTGGHGLWRVQSGIERDVFIIDDQKIAAALQQWLNITDGYRAVPQSAETRIEVTKAVADMSIGPLMGSITRSVAAIPQAFVAPLLALLAPLMIIGVSNPLRSELRQIGGEGGGFSFGLLMGGVVPVFICLWALWRLLKIVQSAGRNRLALVFLLVSGLLVLGAQTYYGPSIGNALCRVFGARGSDWPDTKVPDDSVPYQDMLKIPTQKLSVDDPGGEVRKLVDKLLSGDPILASKETLKDRDFLPRLRGQAFYDGAVEPQEVAKGRDWERFFLDYKVPEVAFVQGLETLRPQLLVSGETLKEFIMRGQPDATAGVMSLLAYTALAAGFLFILRKAGRPNGLAGLLYGLIGVCCLVVHATVAMQMGEVRRNASIKALLVKPPGDWRSVFETAPGFGVHGVLATCRMFSAWEQSVSPQQLAMDLKKAVPVANIEGSVLETLVNKRVPVAEIAAGAIFCLALILSVQRVMDSARKARRESADKLRTTIKLKLLMGLRTIGQQRSDYVAQCRDLINQIEVIR
jgi:hypothetical protein